MLYTKCSFYIDYYTIQKILINKYFNSQISFVVLRKIAQMIYTDQNQNAFLTFLKSKKTQKVATILFIILTVSMMICGNMFSVYDWIQHPQFTEELVTQNWFTANANASQKTIFYTFFILDFLWAPLLWFLLGKYVYKQVTKKNIKWLFRWFIIIAFIALTFDFTENCYYILYNEYPEIIVSIKIAVYSIGLLMALLIWLRFSLKDKFLVFKEFLASAWISLLFLFIIGLSLPEAPLLNSIIVDLYYHPYWFVVALLLFYAPIYCIVLSHYPTYVFLSKSNRKFKDKEWRMTKVFAIFGIVWYKNKGNSCNCDCHKNTCCDCRKEKSKTDSFEYESRVSFLRRTIGILFYGAIFYMIAFTADTNFHIGMKFSGLSKLLVIALIWWLYVLNAQKNAWRLYYATPFYYNKTREKPATANPFTTYGILFITAFLAHIALLVILIFSEHPYNITTVILSLLCIALQAITYTYYRTFRSLFKYAFFNKNSRAILDIFLLEYKLNPSYTKEEKEKDIIQRFENHNYFGQTKLFKLFSTLRFGAVSNHILFLKIIAVFGVVNLLLLIMVNVQQYAALKVNAIIILISAFFLFYGIIIITLKHFIYYNLSVENFAKNNKKKFFFTITSVVLILAIANYFARSHKKMSNNLFELIQIKETTDESQINLTNYVENLPNTRYYIGCYGGGMKANAWTMNVLNALDKNNTLYDKTVCLSGASGGTIGLINYSAIKHKNDSQKVRDSIIRVIGTENILSMDITHVTGRDWFLHVFVPCDLRGKDRSTSAMRIYAKHTDRIGFSETEFNNKSYRKYWSEMYKKRGNRFPILISNTTNIKGRQGMAVSISASNDAKELLYLGADNILEFSNNSTLSFYNAVSTTNRFPLISPAATIEGVGQYNDGGIYENSGMLSALKLYEAINSIDTTVKDQKNVFINIVNDKSAYVKFRMQEIMDDCHGGEINKSSEIAAITNSVAATEMFPSYVKDKLRFMDIKNANIEFESIYLPHQFDLEDVQAIYGQKIKDTVCVKRIAQIIHENNAEIKSLMQGASKETNTIIEPAMSRVMAVPAFDFMQYMLEHSCVKPLIEKYQ